MSVLLGKRGKPKRGYVYVATCTVNGKQYVGKTMQWLSRRKLRHFKDAEAGSSLIFHRAIRKYGRDAFIWEAVCRSSNERHLYVFEKWFIEDLNTKSPHGYNMTDGGEGAFGFTWSPEAKKRMSERLKGRVFTPQHLAEMSRVRREIFSCSRGDAWRAKNKKARLGRKHTTESKLKMSRKRKGRKLSLEHARRISEGRKKQLAGPEGEAYRLKMKAAGKKGAAVKKLKAK